MCLGIPAKIIEIDPSAEKAKADFGGITRTINISLVDTKPGDYVIVHAGFAIQTMDEQAAKETLSIFQQILEMEIE
jgi:hydrogenase expression/formation protein HypC